MDAPHFARIVHEVEELPFAAGLPRDPIDVGRVDQLRAIGGDGGRRMVVGKDEDDIGPT